MERRSFLRLLGIAPMLPVAAAAAKLIPKAAHDGRPGQPNLIVDGAITSAKIVANTIMAGKITANEIRGSMIMPGSGRYTYQVLGPASADAMKRPVGSVWLAASGGVPVLFERLGRDVVRETRWS